MKCCNLKILDYNYAFQDNVGISATSENPEFPVSNLRNPFRSKLWQSEGHFEITAVNKYIDFSEGGPELTAILSEGHYSVSQLQTEIKNKMEAVGAEIYTVNYIDNQGKWTISTGGSVLDLLFGTGTNAANTTGPSIGFHGGDRTGSLSYTGGVAIHTDERVVFDLQTMENFDSLGIFFDPLRGIRYTEASVIRLQANNTLNWSSPPLNILLTIDNDHRVISHFFEEAQNYRYVSIYVSDPANPDLHVELGLVFFGLGIQLERGASSGFVYKIRDDSVVLENQFGNSYSDKRPKVQRLEMNFPLMPKADLLTLKRIITRVGKTEPVMVSFDSAEEVFDKDLFLIYGKFTTQLEATHIVHERFTAPVNIEETF